MPSTVQEQETSFPLHWGPLYRKTTLTKAKSSSGPFPAIYFLTCRHGTHWCRREKTRSKEGPLITMEGFRSFESLIWQSHLFLVFEPMLDWSKQLIKGSRLLSKQNVSLARATFASLARSISYAL